MLSIYLNFLTIILPFAAIFYARLIVPIKLNKKWKIITAVAFILLAALAALAIPVTLSVAHNKGMFDQYYVAAWLPLLYIAMVAICLLIAFVFCRDIVWLVKYIVELVRQKKEEASAPEANAENAVDSTPSDETKRENELMSRRMFFKRTSTAAAFGCAVVATPVSYYLCKTVRVIKRIDIPLKAFPAAIDGLRIAHLSDIHVGNTFFEKDIAEIVEETNALEPDIIVITGDIADGYPETIGSWLNPMKQFKSKYGVWFVTGNHDHLWDARGWCEVVKNLGIHVLDNEHEIVDIQGTNIAIAGAIDKGGDRKDRKWLSDPEKALADIPEELFKLMLVHQPGSVDRSFAAGADLVLLGHTHGGQCWPLNYIIDALHTYARGLYEVGEKAAFVSCGTGYWGPPLRFGIPCEIDLLTLHHKQ